MTDLNVTERYPRNHPVDHECGALFWNGLRRRDRRSHRTASGWRNARCGWHPAQRSLLCPAAKQDAARAGKLTKRGAPAANTYGGEACNSARVRHCREGKWGERDRESENQPSHHVNTLTPLMPSL
jgi:hypothetical protein